MEDFITNNQQPDESNIRPQMSVEEIMTRWPKTIPVFIHYRTNCVGCNMAVFETLEDAARIYRLCLEHFLHDLEAATHESGPAS